jgi:hypothetical protein
MDMEKLASIFEAVKVLPLRPSDMLVFRSNAPLNLEQMAEVHRYIEEETGHTRILILVGGAELAILRSEAEPTPPAHEREEPLAHRPIAGVAMQRAPGAI